MIPHVTLQIEFVKHKIIKIYKRFDSVNNHMENRMCVFGRWARVGDSQVEILKYKKMTAISVLTSSALVAKLPWHTTVRAFQFLVLG